MIKRIFAVIFLGAALAMGGLYYVYEEEKAYLNTPVLNESTLLFELPSGYSVARILGALEEKKIVPSIWQQKLLKRALRFIEPELAQLKAGTYEIAPTLTLRDVLTIFSKGKEHQFSHQLTEGKTFKQWMTQLNSSSDLIHKLTGKSEADIAKLLGSEYLKLEGLLLPETYHYTKGSSDLSLLKRSYKEMQILLAKEWDNRIKSPYIKTPYEALILASIIEKETAQNSERAKVASVFMNRLKKGMRLQTDPTVIYGMGDKYNGNITRKDLRTPTEYNTYVISGLPPTPIAMPSKKSIHAALHPDSTKFYYFVANGKGGHTFSRTLKQHNRAVKEYLRILKKKK